MQIVAYVTENGDIPFREWINTLSSRLRARIRHRLRRIDFMGGDSLPVGNVLMMLFREFTDKPRVYYQTIDNTMILLCGGNKETEKADREKAEEYWGYVQWLLN